MTRGEMFERKSFDYLSQTYGSNTINFIWHGGMDSTISDIEVTKNGVSAFFIEAKDSSAQSGQFVLLPDESHRRFIFSPRNKSEQNEMTDIIINYMNDNFSQFNSAGTAGKALDISPNIFASWIIEHYKSKKVKYFITQYKEFVIFPISAFLKYFTVSATYRIKKSGSSKPSISAIPTIKRTISSKYPLARFVENEKSIFVELKDSPDIDKFIIGDYTYYLSPRDGNLFEVRRLSNTYNMNVIFSISLKRNQDQSDLETFQSELE